MSGSMGLESPRHAYTVHEPDDTGDVGSEKSHSLDGSEQFRFSMADMEAYLRILQTDRCASSHVLNHCTSACPAIPKPPLVDELNFDRTFLAGSLAARICERKRSVYLRC